MILNKKQIAYFSELQAKTNMAMVNQSSNTPYFIENDRFIRVYECFRSVWLHEKTVVQACKNSIFPDRFIMSLKRVLLTMVY